MSRNELLPRFLIIVLCLAAIAIPLAPRLTGNDELLHARTAENGGWTPNAIRAQAGQPLHLRITSDDVMHSFAIAQSDRPAVDIEPGKVTELELTFDKPGTYTFYCTRWCGLNHWRMRGTIKVEGGAAESKPAEKPLYVQLGLDLDAARADPTIPKEKPSAVSGNEHTQALAELERLLSQDYYRAHSPAQAFDDLAQSFLSDPQKWDFVAYLWRSNTTAEELEEGKQLYAQNCAACHGEAGAGNGVFADDLAAAGEDSMQGMQGTQGMSMQRPADFTDPGRMMSASPAMLQGKILRGGMGTGMPMWGEIFTDEQTWNLVAYLYSLQFRY